MGGRVVRSLGAGRWLGLDCADNKRETTRSIARADTKVMKIDGSYAYRLLKALHPDKKDTMSRRARERLQFLPKASRYCEAAVRRLWL